MFNATVRVKGWQDNVVFLHEVLPGSADRSYGIQVAKLAGLPPAVITRAKSVLAKLEAQDRGQTARALVDDLPLFAVPSRAAAEATLPGEAEALIDAVKALHPDEMTPREALEALYALKAKLPKGSLTSGAACAGHSTITKDSSRRRSPAPGSTPTPNGIVPRRASRRPQDQTVRPRRCSRLRSAGFRCGCRISIRLVKTTGTAP